MMMIAQLAEWLIAAIRLNFLWRSIFSPSITNTVTVGIQEILFISYVPASLETRTCFTWIIK